MTPNTTPATTINPTGAFLFCSSVEFESVEFPDVVITVFVIGGVSVTLLEPLLLIVSVVELVVVVVVVVVVEFKVVARLVD